MNDTGATIVASDVREASHRSPRRDALYDASLPGHADEGWFVPIAGMAACRSSGRPVAAAPSRSSAMTRSAGCCSFLGVAAVRWRACSTTVTCTPARIVRGAFANGACCARWRRSTCRRRDRSLHATGDGPFYRADLLTAELPSRTTLAQALVSTTADAALVRHRTRCIGRFHAHGVRHADLNANNIVLGPAREVYLLDFDRGRIVARGAREDAVLARLERSLVKVTQALPAGRYGRSMAAAARRLPSSLIGPTVYALYVLLTRLALPFALVADAWQALRTPGQRGRVAQRLGFVPANPRPGACGCTPYRWARCRRQQPC